MHIVMRAPPSYVVMYYSIYMIRADVTLVITSIAFGNVCVLLVVCFPLLRKENLGVADCEALHRQRITPSTNIHHGHPSF